MGGNSDGRWALLSAVIATLAVEPVAAASCFMQLTQTLATSVPLRRNVTTPSTDASYDSEYDAGYDSEFDAGYDVGYDANALNVKSNTFEGIEERCLFKWCHRRCGPARIGQKSRTRLRGAHG